MELTDDAGFFMETQEGTGSSARDAPMSDGKAGFDLIDLGMFETLPPHEVLEELCVVSSPMHAHDPPSDSI